MKFFAFEENLSKQSTAQTPSIKNAISHIRTLEKRIKKLEENISIIHFDPIVDAELAEWFQSHPEYEPFTQPENNNGIVISQAFSCRMNKLFAEKNLEPDFCNLHKIYEDLF